MKIININLLLLLLTFSLSESSLAMDNACNGSGENKSLNSNEEAKKCVQYKFQNDSGLYNFAKKGGHLGDTGDDNEKCKSDLGNKSYFSEKENLFNTAVNGINVTSCKLDEKNSNAYRCIGTTPGPACQKKAIITNKIVATIDKNNKNFVSFYPSAP